MSLYKGRFLSVVLAAALGAGVVACDSSSDDEADEEQSVEEDSEASAPVELSQQELEALPFYASGPVARVNGEEVGPNKFNELVKTQIERMPMQIQPQMVQRFKAEILEGVIGQHLIDVEMEGEDVEVTDEDVDEAFGQFRAVFGEDESTFQQQLQMMGITEDELKEEMRGQVELQHFLARTHDLDVEEGEARAFFEENEEHFAPGDQVHARHILLQLQPGADDAAEAEVLARANEISEQASADGADFEELAREHSEGPTAERGGDLGFFSHGDMLPAFSEVAFNMEPGTVSEPVRSQHGFHVIQVVEFREGGSTGFAEAQAQIEFQLTQQKFQEVFRQFLEGLKADAEIERLDDNIVVNLDAPAQPQGMPQMPQGGGQGGQPQIQLEQGQQGQGGEQELQLQLNE